MTQEIARVLDQIEKPEGLELKEAMTALEENLKGPMTDSEVRTSLHALENLKGVPKEEAPMIKSLLVQENVLVHDGVKIVRQDLSLTTGRKEDVTREEQSRPVVILVAAGNVDPTPAEVLHEAAMGLKGAEKAESAQNVQIGKNVQNVQKEKENPDLTVKRNDLPQEDLPIMLEKAIVNTVSTGKINLDLTVLHLKKPVRNVHQGAAPKKPIRELKNLQRAA